MPINIHYGDTPLFLLPTASFSINIDTRHILFLLFAILTLSIAGFMLYILLPLFPHKHHAHTPTLTNPTVTNLTVAQDGSGDYATISAAVDAAPTLSKHMFVIRIRSGVYRENVVVGPNKTNIAFVGDGVNKTIITSNRSSADGTKISDAATIWVSGDGFVAKYLRFENTARPDQGPAPAASIKSDKSAFYRCSFVGHHATLYAISNTHFYEACDLFGSVDVIRGDATAVFQNCRIYARPPSIGQNITITAQERSSLGSPSGFSLQNCSVMVAPDLPPRQRLPMTAYMGRPLGNYSTVVVMQSFLDHLIDPAGWLDWQGRSALSTLYFGEYGNRGLGANVQRRVRWPGYRVLSRVEASNFTVANFLAGEEWLPLTGVPFTPDLS